MTVEELLEFLERVKTLQQNLLGITITGPGWSGNVRDGFEFRPGKGGAAEPLGAGGPPIPPPPPSTGACCYIDGTCDELSSADCAAAGGTWQGVDTTCAGLECFNCFSGSIHVCCDISADCAGTGICPCDFSQSWAESCCFDPPDGQCGNNDVAVSGGCNCPDYTPGTSWSIQAFNDVVDGECVIHITIGLFPGCFNPGFPLCQGLCSKNYTLPFFDFSATISDTINGTNADCTFTADVTWSPA